MKLRPVLIVQADGLNSGLSQVVVAMISSNMRRAGHRSRVSLQMGSLEGRQAGVLTDSVVMTDNLATVELSLLSRRIGRLPSMQNVDTALKNTLAL